MSSEARIPLSDPVIEGNEEEYVRDCVRSGWISGAGPYLRKLEESVTGLLGGGHAVAVSSGTSALHLALLIAGVEPGDEVLLSNLTFIATANAILHCGAVPVVIDAEPNHWQLDCDALERFLATRCEIREGCLFNRESGRRIAALIPVHASGYPCDMERIDALRRTHPLFVIEDAAGALGSTLRGRHAGTFGDIGCFSFNGNKIVTTGGGGMLVTRNAEWAARARHLANQAKSDPLEYIHDAVAFNYRLSNLQAAFGCAQMEKLPHFISRRREINRAYRERLAGIPGLSWASEAGDVFWNGWQTTLAVDAAAFGCSARQLGAHLLGKNIESRPLWRPVHLSPVHAAQTPFPLPISDLLYERGLTLPSSGSLSDGQVERVAHAIAQCHRSG